jgi:hypothetical protein
MAGDAIIKKTITTADNIKDTEVPHCPFIQKNPELHIVSD